MTTTDILIAGAGLAGLSLASALQRRGTDYQLVEARDRIGGRIISNAFTSPDQRSSVADMGPSWIWPGQAHIARLLGELEIEVFEQYSNGLLVYEDETGQVRRDLDYSAMAGSLRIDGGVARVTRRLAEQLDKDRLQLGQRVQAIHKRADGFCVTVGQTDGERQIEARKLVLAIPPRVIARQIEFEPGLSDDVMQAMNAIPTWMAAHAKLFARYDRPFWRELGLSGDGISRRGPLMEIHDASPREPGHGVLFGFVGLAPDSAQRDASRLADAAVVQLEKMFAAEAANPLDVSVMDWSREAFTATPADQLTSQHPRYGIPAAMAALADDGLLFASSEMGTQFGGFIEGALEAAQQALEKL